MVLIPGSSGLAGGHIVPEEVDAVVSEVELLRARPDVDPARIGILGFSVGGSVAIQAAADPRIADKLVLVNAFGSYNDATDLVRAAATRSLAVCRRGRGLGAASFDALGARSATGRYAARGGGPRCPRPRLSPGRPDRPRRRRPMTPVGRAALGILDGLPPAEAEQAIAALPPATLARLHGISPSGSSIASRRGCSSCTIAATTSCRTPSRGGWRLRCRPAHLEQFAEFDLFDHVMPDRRRPSMTFYVELARLFRQLYGVLLYVL